MMRKSYAEVKKNLSPEMEDACNEIEVGFNCVAGLMGYPNHDLSSVKTGGGESFHEWSVNISNKVKSWRCDIDQKITGVVIDYLVFGKDFTTISKEHNICRQTASSRFYSGLNEYCKMYFS